MQRGTQWPQDDVRHIRVDSHFGQDRHTYIRRNRALEGFDRAHGHRWRPCCYPSHHRCMAGARWLLREQQQTMTHDVLGRDLLWNVLLASWQGRQHRFLAQRLNAQLTVLDRQGDQRKIRFVAEDLGNAERRGHVGHDKIDTGMIASQLAQEGWQSVDHRRQRRVQVHPTDPILTKAPHRLLGRCARVKDVLRRLDELPSGCRSMGLLPESLDERHAETSLELAYLQTDSRLREIEAARRRREAPALHHFDQSAQLVEIYVAHLKAALIEPIETTN